MAARGESDDLLRRACDAMRARHRVADLDAAAFARDARRHAAARLERLGLAAEDAHVEAALGRMCLEDLCLAHACDGGNESAWAAFHGAYSPRLVGLALKHGLDRERAEAEVGSLFADLALPPPRAAAATVLGTYRGTGSLFGWLAVILTRRFARAGRRLRPVSLDAAPTDRGDEALQHDDDPSAPLEDAEAAEALRAALRAGWQACTPREQLALVLKHRDGRPHREVADALGVGVPRVSQLLQQALTRLAAAVRQHLPDGLDARARALAARETRNALATFDPPAPPTRGDGAPGEHA